MVVRGDKVRFMISISEDLFEKMEMVSKKYGLTKSGLCAYWIGQGCHATLEQWETLEKMPEKMVLKDGDGN